MKNTIKLGTLFGQDPYILVWEREDNTVTIRNLVQKTRSYKKGKLIKHMLDLNKLPLN